MVVLRSSFDEHIAYLMALCPICHALEGMLAGWFGTLQASTCRQACMLGGAWLALCKQATARLQQLVQLHRAFLQAAPIRAVDHVDQRVGVVKVVAPASSHVQGCTHGRQWREHAQTLAGGRRPWPLLLQPLLLTSKAEWPSALQCPRSSG